MAFNEKIIEVKGLLAEVNTLLVQQKVALDETSKSIQKYASVKLPSDFRAAQNEIILNSKKIQEQTKQQALVDKEVERVKREQLATQIKLNQAKKSDIALSDAELRSKKAVLAANEKLNSAYTQLNNSRTAAKNKLRDLVASEQASNAEIRKAQREFDILDKKVRKADLAVRDFGKSVGNYRTALGGVTQLMGAFGIATGLALGADVIRNIYQTTKELQSLDLALKMVSETQDKYASNTNFIREISEKWGIEIKGLTEQFTQFYVNAKGKLSDDAIRTSFESIAKAGSLMGISIDKQNDAFYAFNQMLSKGTVQAEELKKQLGNALPGAIKAATMAYQELNPNLKVTEQMMLDQMKAGKLISNDMVPAIIRAYQKLYGIENINGVNTLAAAQNRLSNSWTDLVRSMNESETGGISSFFSIVTTGLADILKLITEINDTNSPKSQKLFDAAQIRGEKKVLEDINREKQNGLLTDKEVAESKKKYAQEQVENIQWELNALTDKAKLEEKTRGKGVTPLAMKLGFSGTATKEQVEAARSLVETNKKIQELSETYGFYSGVLKGANQYLTDLNKTNDKAVILTDKQIKANEKAAKTKQKLDDELSKNSYERRISDLEREKEQIKDLRDLEKTSLEDKLFLEEAYAFKELQINKVVYDEKIRLAKGNADKEQIALNEFLTANENALSESLARQNKLKEDALKTEAEKTKEWYDKNPPMFLDSKKEKEEAEKIKAILADLRNEFRDYLQDFQSTFFNNAGLSKTFDFFIKVDEDGKSMFDRLNDDSFTSAEKFKSNFLGITESAQEMFNLINQISAQNFEAQKERLSEEKETALAFAGDSATARAEIERQYEEKLKEIRIREFKTKKRLAIVNIAIDTAQAIMATYGQAGFFGGLAGAILLGAIGAAQIAIVQSQPVPEFWEGGIHEKGGVLKMNDDPKGVKGSNYREVAVTPDGRIFKPQGKDVYVDLPKGTEIFKDYNAFNESGFNRSLDSILMSNEINYAQPNVVVNSGMSDAQVDRIVSSINNKSEAHLNIDKNGFNVKIRNGHTTKEILNNQVTFGR